METVGLKAGFLLARMKAVQAANFRQPRTGTDTRTGWLLNSDLNVGDFDPALLDATTPHIFCSRVERTRVAHTNT
jgi:hypothetical protein